MTELTVRLVLISVLVDHVANIHIRDENGSIPLHGSVPCCCLGCLSKWDLFHLLTAKCADRLAIKNERRTYDDLFERYTVCVKRKDEMLEEAGVIQRKCRVSKKVLSRRGLGSLRIFSKIGLYIRMIVASESVYYAPGLPSRPLRRRNSFNQFGLSATV